MRLFESGLVQTHLHEAGQAGGHDPVVGGHRHVGAWIIEVGEQVVEAVLVERTVRPDDHLRFVVEHSHSQRIVLALLLALRMISQLRDEHDQILLVLLVSLCPSAN